VVVFDAAASFRGRHAREFAESTAMILVCVCAVELRN
jgi:hypothetical protein